MVQGAYIQWLCDTHPDLNSNIYKIIIIIARFTLGNRYKYAFIKSSQFKMPIATKKRYIKQAKNIGLINYERTFDKKNKSGYTKFWLILPNNIEKNILWKNNNYINDDQQKEPIKEEDEGALYGWQP